MQMKQKWSVGEIRKIGEGKWVQCIEGRGCNNCYFFKSDNCPLCYYEYISGNKRVIFKELENIGDPIEYNGQWFQMVGLADKAQGCRQCVFRGYCLKEEIHCKIDTVFVEVKDYKPKNNKSMEEKENEKKADLMSNTETQVQLLYSEYSDNKITLKNLVSKLKELFSEENKVNCIPFDIEKAINGRDVCTRDGRKARILCYDLKGAEYPIVAAVETRDRFAEIIFGYDKNGRFDHDIENNNDLMMLQEKKSGWINVYKRLVYRTKEEAQSNINPDNEVIDTIKISWEE